MFQSFYLYLAAQLLFQLSVNLCTSFRVSKLYPSYVPRGDLPREKVLDIARRVRDLFTAKFSAVISDSADTLVITSFLGLASLALYQNYFFVITSVRSILDVFVNACIAGIGNSLITESTEKNYKDLQKLSMLFAWLLGVSSALMLCLYQPFMTIWMGEENLLGFSLVICFTVYYYFIGMNRLLNMFKDAAGLWHRDRFRPLTAALVNLALNLLTVRWLGLYGVLISTVISIVAVEFPWLLHNLFVEIFPRKQLWEYVRSFLGYVFVSAACCFASYGVCSLVKLNVWFSFFFNAIVSFGLANLLFFLFYGKNPLFLACFRQIKGVALKLIKRS